VDKRRGNEKGKDQEKKNVRDCRRTAVKSEKKARGKEMQDTNY